MGGEHMTTMCNSKASCFRLSWVELRWVLTIWPRYCYSVRLGNILIFRLETYLCTGLSIICVFYKFLITRARFNYRCQKICHFFTDTGTFRYLLLIFTYINFENFNIWDSLKNKKWDLTPKCLIFGYFGSKITKKLFLEALQPLNIDSCLSPHIGKLI